MARIDLPAKPGPVAVNWRVVDAGGTLTPPLGGALQRINRLGNRWAISVTLPALSLASAREWSAAMALGLRNGVRWRVRQVGLEIGAPGTVLVAGGSQGGLTLNVDGGTPYAPFQVGQFVSILTGGNRYLHMLAASGNFSSGGTAALAFTEPLRVAPADNSPVEFVPQIEGMLVGDAPNWTIDRMRLGRTSFAIMEMA